MAVLDIIMRMRQEMEEELVSNILPFWINRMTDEVNGGFYGRITGREEVKPEAEKGAILNARILWTFSAAYRLLKRPEYLETATRAKRTLIDRFYDNEFGGVYWSLDYKGNPLDTKKQIYALGFAIYGLSEYARATGDDEALAYAIRLFETIEEHSFDPVKNGYCEALTREWGEIADMRLSAK
ncbi:AGE family epimerase/isomerase, partial [Bacteroides uniformis]